MSVLVYTENWDGKFKKLSFELVSYAASLAEMLKTSVTALSIGEVDETELKKLGNYGATRAVTVTGDKYSVLDSQAFTKVVAGVASDEKAEVIVVANNNTGKAIAPRLAVRLKASVGAGVNRLPVSLSPFTVSKKVYSGNAYAKVVLKSDIKIITLAQNSFDLKETGGSCEIVTFTPDTGGDTIKTSRLDIEKQTGKLLLTDAEIVVSGGRGMKSPDNWGPLLELAELLGGATACSRPVSDEGWRPHDEHTGQTGKIIAPNLYIAVGISGATQHIAGVSSAKYIVAINTDKDAPIFEVAQYGIIGDAMKVLPKLVEAVKEIKEK